MKLVLTRMDGVKITVDSDLIKLIEPQSATEGTHIVFGSDMVRTVSETMEEINAALGAIALHAIIASMVVPKTVKKK